MRKTRRGKTTFPKAYPFARFSFPVFVLFIFLTSSDSVFYMHKRKTMRDKMVRQGIQRHHRKRATKISMKVNLLEAELIWFEGIQSWEIVFISPSVSLTWKVPWEFSRRQDEVVVRLHCLTSSSLLVCICGGFVAATCRVLTLLSEGEEYSTDYFQFEFWHLMLTFGVFDLCNFVRWQFVILLQANSENLVCNFLFNNRVSEVWLNNTCGIIARKEVLLIFPVWLGGFIRLKKFDYD